MSQADQRGVTHIPARVVEKVVAQAASEVHGVGASRGGFMGMGGHQDFSALPEIECDLYGSTVVIRANIGVEFPLPLADRIDALREHLDRSVERMLGMSVARLDVTVSWLHSHERARGELL